VTTIEGRSGAREGASCVEQIATTLPSPKAVRDVLLELLGRDVEVAMGGPWAPTPKDPGTVAVYTDDRSQLRALVFCDLALSACMGTALALIPASTARECIEAKSLTSAVSENVYEIFNIVASFFNLPERAHLRLYGMHAPGEHPPTDVSARLRGFGNRLDLKVTIAGYGAGRMTVMVI
jgi:hypothetical protein